MRLLRVREMVRKEFIQLFRDKRNRPILIIVPFIQLLIFGYVMTTDVRTVRVGFLDQSMTRESRMLFDTLNANRTFDVTFTPDRPSDLERRLLERKIDIAVKVPPDFSGRIRKGETAAVQVLTDGTRSHMSSMMIAYTTMVINDLNRKLLGELYPYRLQYGRIDARIRPWYNPDLYSRNFFVPGIVAFLIMILSLLFTSMAIVKEKEIGTMEQLIVTPITPADLILGKTIPYIIISIIQMCLVIVFAVFWFDIPLVGSVTLLFLGILLFLLSTLAIGLFVSTISSTQQQAMMTTFFFILPLFMLSGFVFPIENMPPLVRVLTYLNPARYILVIIRGIFLKGVGLSALWHQYLALTVLGLVLFNGAARRFRKRLD
ncbi:MAG: ABC transporter permease [Deltaproteobacteria bacterium]|nr:ABC transporter permease [Deltaproteobacteria bacterium]